MPYLYSQVDKDNLKWFEKNGQYKTLKSIELKKGKLRGLYPCTIEFNYPISAIAGKNGAGKSTILAMASCAYHNKKEGYMPADHNKTYYTFSDFFVGTIDEQKIEGIIINYIFRVIIKNVKTKEKFARLRKQIRMKKQGGRWNDYGQRYSRNVIFSGIQRIVPPSERKTERSYSGRFESAKIDLDTKKRILDIASRVLGKNYTSLDLRTVNKRRLFVVDHSLNRYSGFNMGAGENAIFTVLIELFSAREGTLLVIDEIELGLHEEVQRKFIKELKEICKDLKCQVICSTHSSIILDSLPPEGRFFVDSYDQKTVITSGISSEYAMGKLSGTGKEELIVYVEDNIGQAVVSNSLPGNIRERIGIIPIGSDQAVLRQLAARYRDQKYNCIAFLDGDKRSTNSTGIRQIKQYLEDRFECTDEEMDQWISDRLKYLPGSTWPELWLLQRARVLICDSLSKLWRVDADMVFEYFNEAILAGKHKEFHKLSQKTFQNVEQIESDIVRYLTEVVPIEFEYIENDIRELIER